MCGNHYTYTHTQMNVLEEAAISKQDWSFDEMNNDHFVSQGNNQLNVRAIVGASSACRIENKWKINFSLGVYWVSVKAYR